MSKHVVKVYLNRSTGEVVEVKGAEALDPTPVAVPVGMTRNPLSLLERLKRFNPKGYFQFEDDRDMDLADEDDFMDDMQVGKAEMLYEAAETMIDLRNVEWDKKKQAEYKAALEEQRRSEVIGSRSKVVEGTVEEE